MTDIRTTRFSRLRNMGPRERALAIVIGVIVVLVVLFLLLSGGGGGEIPPVTSNPAVRPSPSANGAPTSPPETGQTFEGKDPFQPLVVAAAAGSTGGTTGTTTTGSPAPQPSGSITGVNGGNTASPSTTVTLIDIRKVNGKLVATLDVDGKDYTAGVGQTFAQNFRVVSLSSSCGTFVFGDERFSLCEGQEINK